jgi:hypothetical protein
MMSASVSEISEAVTEMSIFHWFRRKRQRLRFTGVVQRWDEVAGLAYIMPHELRPIITITRRRLRTHGYRQLDPGDRVELTVTENHDGELRIRGVYRYCARFG